MNQPPLSSSLNQSEKKFSDFLSKIEKSKPLLTASSAAFAPTIFLFFLAMAFPTYSIAKVLELGARNTVKYPGQLNSYVKDQSQFAGSITGIVEYFAGMGVNKFKDFAGMVAEFIPAEDRSVLAPEKIEELYKGILRYNESGEMVEVPAGQEVRPFGATNVFAKANAESHPNQTTPLNI